MAKRKQVEQSEGRSDDQPVEYVTSEWVETDSQQTSQQSITTVSGSRITIRPRPKLDLG